MKQADIDRAVEAFRRCCPHSTPCKRLDGTTFVMNCWEWGSKEHGYKCENRICKRLRKFINILKEPEQ